MAIKLFYVLLFNILDGIVILASGSYLVMKLIHVSKLHKLKKEAEKTEKTPLAEDDILTQSLIGFRKKYMISFYVLDAAMLVFFIFWAIIFYFKIPFA